MQNQGGKEQAQELSPVETPAQAVVSGLAEVGRAASPASDKGHKKHTKKRPKSADVFRNGSKSPEGGAESPPARSNKPKRESKAKKSDATSGPPPSSRPSSPLELSQAPLASVGKGAAPAEALPAAPPPGAPEAPKPADLATHPPARDVPALRGFDNTLAAADQGKPKMSPESLGDSSPGRGKKAKREPKAKSNDPAPQPSHDMSPKPLPPPQAFVEKPAALSVAADPGVHAAPKPVDHDTHLAARDVPELREFGNSLPMIEQRRPNKSIIPMIASVGIICLMLVIIISMLVSNRRRARAAGTNTATPATMIDDGVEMTATSATITVVTGSENATSSHSHETVPEQT